MIGMDDESASAVYLDERMLAYLERVAITRGITGKSIDSCVERVHNKLHKVGIISVRATVSRIVILNKKIFAAGLPAMHAETLAVMAREGANALSIEALEAIDTWDVELHEVGDGICERCDDTGDIGEPCATCNTGSYYLTYHTGL
jgi:copper chaperone CopZ